MNKLIERVFWENSIKHHTNYERRNIIIIGICWASVIVFCAGVALAVNLLSL